jgi:chromatin remodeling complex protein RSC6
MALVDYGSSSEDESDVVAPPRKTTLLSALPAPKAKAKATGKAAEADREAEQTTNQKKKKKMKRKIKPSVLGDIAAKRAALLSIPDAPVTALCSTSLLCPLPLSVEKKGKEKRRRKDERMSLSPSVPSLSLSLYVPLSLCALCSTFLCSISIHHCSGMSAVSYSLS